MEKTVQYSLTSELFRAGTAYAAYNARAVLGGLWCLCVGTTAASYVVLTQGENRFAGRLLAAGAFCTAWIAIYLHFVLLTSARRNQDNLPMEYRVRLSDTGIEPSPGPGTVVPWTDVHRVRTTPVFWALHYVHDGKKYTLLIPAELVDDELATFMRERTRGCA